MATYFGTETYDSTTSNSGSMRWLDAGFVCPGSGTQNVSSLEVYIGNAGTGTVRAGIYNSSGNLVAEWATALDPESTGWLSGTSFINAAGNPLSPVQLTGGQTYRLAIYPVSSGLEYGYLNCGATDGQYDFADHSGGLPDTIPGGDDVAFTPTIRCGVEAAAGGSAVVIMANISRRRRG